MLKKNEMNFQTSTQKKADVFQSGTLGETTARAEKENADRAASRKKSRGKGREGRGGGNVIGKANFRFRARKTKKSHRKRLEAKIESLCSAFNLPVKVTVSATTLFKRYCLARIRYVD